jgi:hypothetical protein
MFLKLCILKRRKILCQCQMDKCTGAREREGGRQRERGRERERRGLKEMSNRYSIWRLEGGSECIAMVWMAGVKFPAGARHFSPLHYVQSDSGVHPTPYPMDTGGCFPRNEVAGT